MSTPLDASTAISSTTSGLPLVDQALEPASVREGSPARQQAYARALDFESMLVQQLSQSLVATSGLGEESEAGSESSTGGEATGASSGLGSASSAGFGGAGGGALSSLLPEALSNGVMSQGGLGLATQLMNDLEPVGATAGVGATTSGATGGAPA